MIEKIYQLVEETCKKETNVFSPEVWQTHFLPVVKYAKLLAKQRKVDIEVVEIAALLHDFASISNENEVEEHHVYGQKHAQQILSDFDYPQEKIDQVKHCIFAHRGSQNIQRETVEADCIADADAMAHFDALASLFYLAYVVKRKGDLEGKKFVRDKLERSWKKLTPDAREVIKDKYEAVKLLIDYK